LAPITRTIDAWALRQNRLPIPASVVSIYGGSWQEQSQIMVRIILLAAFIHCKEQKGDCFVKQIAAFIVITMAVVFTFTSVAWAGPAIYKDLQQVKSQIDNKGTPLSHYDPHRGGGWHPGHPGGHPGGGFFDGHQARYYHWDRGWPHDRPWGRYFRDWEWFVGFGIIGLGAYYLAESADDMVYVHFETENRGYFRAVTQRYGHYIYRERAVGFGGLGWRYYWMNEQNAVCIFVRDDGYCHTFIWSRADAGRQALVLGLLTEDQLADFGEYNAATPAVLVAEYIRIVMWGQTEWR
jgi:hypothetical protein